MVDGEPGDLRRPLGIEKQQQAGEAVFVLEGVVVQQTAGGGPAGLVVHRLGRAVPSDGREAEIASNLLGENPAHEVACLPAVTDVVAGHPAFKIGLTAGRQDQAQGLDPVEEVDGCPQVLADDGELGVRDVVAAAASAEPPQEVPGRVPVQDLPSLGGGVGGDKIVHRPFQADHLLVPLGQNAGGHKHASDVLDDLARREFVQGLVRSRPGTSSPGCGPAPRGATSRPASAGSLPNRSSTRPRSCNGSASGTAPSCHAARSTSTPGSPRTPNTPAPA
ncbi:hypothetical protein ABZ439_28030 [Streptomyces sp. NPDC005840]|uniref:hypothetical protein n=1 Tax=Streptomyces sp. NPDC005840 TaxID=3157072 RepID=UPI0033F63364